jgi:hypothetical protein
MSKPTFQQRLAFDDADLKTPKHDKIMSWLHQVIEAGQYMPEISVTKPALCDIVWEQPIPEHRGNGRAIVGFWDLAVRYRTTLPMEQWDRTVTQEEWCGFEVKTEVRSFGELLRQLQFYRAHSSHRIVVVAPPKSGLAELLATQRIIFLPAPAVVL